MYTCMYVREYICIFVCMYVCMYVCMRASCTSCTWITLIHVCVCMCVCTVEMGGECNVFPLAPFFLVRDEGVGWQRREVGGGRGDSPVHLKSKRA